VAARLVRARATGVGQDLGGGRTTATISVESFEVGTTTAAFTIAAVNGAFASFIGPITSTGLGGTLTAQVAGTFDVATGAFTSTSTSRHRHRHLPTRDRRPQPHRLRGT
jgi:hypothetical protein